MTMLDADKLRADKEAHLRRRQGPFWGDEELTAEAIEALTPEATQARDEAKTRHLDNGAADSRLPPVASLPTGLPAGLPVSLPQPPRSSPPVFFSPPQPLLPPPELNQVLSLLVSLLGSLLPAVERLAGAKVADKQPSSGERRPTPEVPTWLLTAAGDPRSYDAPDADRQSVCVRIQPHTFEQLRSVQERLGLRTQAGAWELLLRLGLAAFDHLPDLPPSQPSAPRTPAQPTRPRASRARTSRAPRSATPSAR